MPKPIYQLYDEWLVRNQKCKICNFQVFGPVQGPQEKFKPPMNLDGETMENHIKTNHPKEVTA